MLPITSTVAALAAVGLIALSVPVSLRRMQVKQAIGMGDDPGLLRRIRAQGNFIEYVPVALILLALAELRGAPQIFVFAIAGSLVIGRTAHAIGMMGGVKPLRRMGMMATFISLLAGVAAQFV
ncbi:MAPEG family protein [Aquamicrobium sp. NLF2-7]|uniref:MAPEG family protein n=1 Tax=Aquamicrobium sp. NLF2-7 TaxID=2918753 RepID=UPI001EFA5F32|nr:MAPEG family protein [Aquamicrobium sp. NLF2-7]MCG8274691.1 MAPEG family protein [Aquamicrobium sp. NLF2-7]